MIFNNSPDLSFEFHFGACKRAKDNTHNLLSFNGSPQRNAMIDLLINLKRNIQSKSLNLQTHSWIGIGRQNTRPQNRSKITFFIESIELSFEYKREYATLATSDLDI